MHTPPLESSPAIGCLVSSVAISIDPGHSLKKVYNYLTRDY